MTALSEALTAAQRRAIAARLLARVVADPDTGCWNFAGCRQANGYGRMGVGRRTFYAHRLSYEALVGEIPHGLEVDHLCRNRACVNPAHLEVVTHRVNSLRGVGAAARHARKTHCDNGHEFTSENTAIEQGKYRRCRACRAERRAA